MSTTRKKTPSPRSDSSKRAARSGAKATSEKRPRPRAPSEPKRPTHRNDDDVGAVSPGIRMRILDGAVDAFVRRGFADTRVEDILEASGVSRPTFYKSYESKDDVFRAIAEMTQVSLVQSIKGAVSTVRDPSDKLAKAVEAYIQWRATTGPIGRVVDLEMRRPGSPLAVLRRTTFAAVRGVLEDEMKRAERLAIDPLVYVGLVAALEAIGNTLFREPSLGSVQLSRRSRVMLRILQATLAEKGDPVAPLPRVGD